jgi:hypothetical protein
MIELLKRNVFPTLIAVLPLLLYFTLTEDASWDGVILEGPIENNNPELLKVFFFQAGWITQYYFMHLIIEIIQFFNIEYRFFNIFLVSNLIILFIYELNRLVREQSLLPNEHVVLFLCLACSSPIFTALTSEMLLFHFAMVTLSYTGVRLYHSNSTFNLFIGFSLSIISFGLLSNLVFVPILSLFYTLTGSRQKGLKRSVFVLLSSIIYFYVLRLYFPPHGTFEGYQPILITKLEGILPFLKGVIQFSSFVFPLAFLVLFLLIFSCPKSPSQRRIQSLISFQKCFYLSFVLVLASIFPYAATSSIALLWAFDDWTVRHGLLMIFPLSLFSYYALCKSNILTPTWKLIDVKALIIILISLNFVVTSISVLTKINRSIFLREVAAAFVEISGDVKPGVLMLVSKDLPFDNFELYELNYHISKLNGKNTWWSSIANSSTPTAVIPTYMSDQRLQKLFLFENSGVLSSPPVTIVSFTSSGFSGLSAAVRNSFGVGSGFVRIDSVKQL